MSNCDSPFERVLGRRVGAQAYYVCEDATKQTLSWNWKHLFNENGLTLHKSVIGHITFVLLGARPALCTLHTCYRFMRAHYHVATRLWTETRAELVAVQMTQNRSGVF